MDYTFHYTSPLGGITLASDGEALTGLWFDGQKYFADTLDAEYAEKALPVFDETAKWLDLYFARIVPGFTPKLNPRGTSFRRRVWDVLLTIPYGQTMTYGEIAQKLGCRSSRAIGGAVGHNPISLIIPCHRVVGAGGSLTGYAGGVDKKRRLLETEQPVKK
ncbi:MAG: methylated-DNA--[Oscillospiraceae bacterium]|nr:methylated-DNA--[protein]-cysteine S-methyltransferase [Oscillospiraceae bacterium]MBR7074928.1 methylated-DNA--[protein]-cysteine S-methyltransferase [Oscillospiraceae bacterium]